MKVALFTIVTLLSFITSFSQEKKESKLTKADRLYEKYAYSEFIRVYEGVAERGFKSVDLFGKLGDAYLFNSDFDRANKWYTELFALEGDKEPIYYYRYSQTLKSVGDIGKAVSYFEQFSRLDGNDMRVKNYKNNHGDLSEIADYSDCYLIEDVGINSSFSDYGLTVYHDKAVFTSSRKPENGKNMKDSWTSDYYTSLYWAALSKEGSLSEVQTFAKEVQGDYHESSPVFTKDGKTMYFAGNDVAKRKSAAVSAVVLKIYKASLIDGQWKDIVVLPFNNDFYSCTHPALSPDEKTLYFVSDMPGGFGDSDLYEVSVGNNGATYGSPVNLGAIVNTSGKETFPYLNTDGRLYFASNGHLGLGGLDLFVTDVKKGPVFSSVLNLGAPLNSSFDDFNYVKLDNSKIGFFSSNREGGKGKDDIYRFKEIKSIIIEEPNVIVSRDDLIAPESSLSDFVFDLNQDLGKYLNLENIFLNWGEYKITHDLEIEFQKIIMLMKIIPSLKIQIIGHTDSTGPAVYNMKLSNQRANAAMDYFVANDVARDRITTKGYGETLLINKCSDGVKCSEAEHRINRRIEFIVTEK
ncbi:OmpA family protein [Flavobacterium sp. LAR06]|uniref:OmpA family protein n=1 Tax=Flavobacterium sp. LAR06 TaxID=3064897 RepID=UPI0035C25A62